MIDCFEMIDGYVTQSNQTMKRILTVVTRGNRQRGDVDYNRYQINYS